MNGHEIIFTGDDFDPIFQQAGVDPASVTEHEWSTFYKMFLDGTGWHEVATIAAEEIKRRREEAEHEREVSFEL